MTTTTVHDMAELELALLRRSLRAHAHDSERCGRCHRSPLVGERVYTFASGATICELCRTLERSAPVESHTVHGPEFGHTLRIIDRRDVQDAAA
jgi:hypothetical protein